MRTKQPTSTSCFVCGRKNPVGLHLDFYRISPTEVQAQVCIPDPYQGYPGVVHGGIIAALLDETAGRAFMDGEPPRFMVTAQLNIRYRKPVPTGKRLTVIGRAEKDSGVVAKATGQIVDETGVVLAEAEGTFMNIPRDQLSGVDYSALGWKVYPDEEEPL